MNAPGGAHDEAAVDVAGAELVAWGKAILLETTGRRTGRTRATPVGFLEEPDGSLRIAASEATTGWARNLAADPHCRVTLRDTRSAWVAEAVDDAERREIVTGLILRYGTPAERLGAGPAFRLRRVPSSGAEPG
ncbi:MAG: nitroreductase family deazaflavin-dependent oxidoreductase [Chloroflexota bacterium]